MFWPGNFVMKEKRYLQHPFSVRCSTISAVENTASAKAGNTTKMITSSL